jgi:hypothetical protein
VNAICERLDHRNSHERHAGGELRALPLGRGDLGHEDPQIALDRDEQAVERIGREIPRAAGAAVSEDGPGVPERGLRFVDRPVAFDAGRVLPDAAPVERNLWQRHGPSALGP